MEERFKDANAKWAEELDKIKSILSQTELQETVKWGSPAFTYNNKNIVELAAFKNYVALWFFKGMYLKDEQKVLFQPDDETKIMRQWRFASADEILNSEKLILQYVKEAIEVEKSGLTAAKKTEKKPLPVSELLKDALAKDAALASAFETLSPYKQKEYIEHLESAKREQTKLDRLEKIKPMIINKLGLHDKYK
jgi:uncharacterized protein YdeI (YjbR/CyaY-like superfamily)